MADTIMTRKDMESAPFSPVPLDPDKRNSRSLEYIAFYLCEMVEQLKTLNANAESLDKTLQAISSKLTPKTD
jgi:hypothetical protein